MSDCIGTGCKADAMMKQIVDLRAERDALAAQNEILQNDCFNLTEKVIPNLREQRDALRALLREAKKFVPAPLGNAILAALAGDKP